MICPSQGDAEVGPWIVVGLGYGDEGKGSVVDWLVRTRGARLVVRFNGGPQAAHHVVTPEGRSHCFSQVGAGTFLPGVETLLAAPMVVDPLALAVEWAVLATKLASTGGLGSVASRMILDPECPVVTPYHAWFNQMLELTRGTEAHGTCGRGLGEVLADQKTAGAPLLHLKDLANRSRTAALLGRIRDHRLAQAEALLLAHPNQVQLKALFEEASTPEVPGFLVDRYQALIRTPGLRLIGAQEYLATVLREGVGVVFEGAQGALLDMDQGFWPHVTPSRTTAENALALLAGLGHPCSPCKIGVTRAYLTRHGAGPLITEDPELARALPEPHNQNDGWQGRMRIGWPDALALRYGITINQGIDRLFVTCLDRLVGLEDVLLCEGYLPLDSSGDSSGDSSRLPVQRLTPVAGDKASRQDQTTTLRHCRPHYRRLEGWKRSDAGHLTEPAWSFLEVLGKRVGQPVDWISIGPTAGDKLSAHERLR